MRDLIGVPANEVAAERARVATEGWGARLLSLQGADGRWGGAAWNRGWDFTMHVLMLLRDLGLDPASDQARRVVSLVRDRVTWQGCGPQECDSNAFFEGDVKPCINGQAKSAGGNRGPSPRAGVPPRAPALPAAVDRRGHRVRSQGRCCVDALRLPDVMAPYQQRSAIRAGQTGL
jgi:hypothetical protein